MPRRLGEQTRCESRALDHSVLYELEILFGRELLPARGTLRGDVLKGRAVKIKDGLGARQAADLAARCAKQIRRRFGLCGRLGIRDVITAQVAFEETVELRAGGWPETVWRGNTDVLDTIGNSQSTVQGRCVLGDPGHAGRGELSVLVVSQHEEWARCDAGQ